MGARVRDWNSGVKALALQTDISAARLEYKRMEFLWQAAFPSLVEEMPEVENPDSMLVMLANLTRAASGSKAPVWTDSAVIEAARMELLRIFTLGLSGFDSPGAQQPLVEIRSALQGLNEYLNQWIFSETSLGNSDPRKPVVTLWKKTMDAGLADLESTEFDSFDRLAFARDRLRPLYGVLLKFRSLSSVPSPGNSEDLAFSPNDSDLFSSSAWNPNHFAAGKTTKTSIDLVNLGRELFFDSVLSKHGERSCASCHRPEMGFSDGISKEVSLSGDGDLPRHTPTLLFSGLQNTQFWDARASSLEEQAAMVIHNPKEMGGSLDSAARRMQQNPEYLEQFRRAFLGENDSLESDGLPSPIKIRRALAAYIRSLSPMNSPWDRYLRGDSSAMTPEAIRGYSLFAGKAQCATCHFPPLFNGSVPPLYHVTETEVLGVTLGPNSKILDSDSGRMAVNRDPAGHRAFKTPTVRNVEFTAPYMHNGAFKTLEEVIDFYDVGGGAGLGLSVPNQTLSSDSLRLTPEEKRDLIVFLKALSDTVGTIPGLGSPTPYFSLTTKD